ncbi:MAG: serine/threonine protein kinase [Candidatus Obscuribacterales bacterium]|nr:serine/threonine protein kinase [Candidatus Obscuribacterales bacterium]
MADQGSGRPENSKYPKDSRDPADPRNPKNLNHPGYSADSPDSDNAARSGSWSNYAPSEPAPESSTTREPGTSNSGLDATIPAQPRKLDENPRRSLSGRLVYLPGVVVGNDYILNDLLGRGGMGVVFSATHRIMGKKFALKLLAPELMTAENWQRFQREARALSRLSHPSIVQIYNMGVDRETTPFYVMELLEGEPLSQILKTNGPLSEKDALSCFTAIAEALAAAHKQKIIHRDIKPANIVVGRDEAGKVVFKLVDFGLARLIDEKEKVLFNDEQNKQALTALGQVFGSPFYMSPEQCRGVDLDSRTDIYSFGCSLFEALTAHVPLAGETPYETFILHQSKVPPKLSTVFPDGKFSEGIELAVEKMLAKSPLMRYQSMDEILHDFARLNAGRAILDQTKESGTAGEKLYQVSSQAFFEPSESASSSDDQVIRRVEAFVSRAVFRNFLVALVIGALLLAAFYVFKPISDKPTNKVSDQFLVPSGPGNGIDRERAKVLEDAELERNFHNSSDQVGQKPFSLTVERMDNRHARLVWDEDDCAPIFIGSSRRQDKKERLNGSVFQKEVQWPIRIVLCPAESGTEFLKEFKDGEVGDFELISVMSSKDWKQVFDQLDEWPKLDMLHFHRCNVDQSFYDFLSRRVLSLLEIHEGNIDLAKIAKMPSFRTLKDFSLEGSEQMKISLPPALIAALAKSTALRQVKLRSTAVTMEQFKAILANPHIFLVEVEGLPFSDADFRWLLDRKIFYLRLSKSDLSEEQIRLIQAIAPKRKKLNQQIHFVDDD